MSRLSNLADVMFPVHECSVFAQFDNRNLVETVRAHGKKAIVGETYQGPRVLGVVSKAYRLVTNEEALGAARACCHTAFPETRPEEWNVSNVDAPGTGSWCNIDLVHNTHVLDFEYKLVGERSEVPDVFGPFIRVTNSYNGRRALHFKIGFQRKVCANGLIASNDLIEFKFDHTKENLSNGFEFLVNHRELEQKKKQFMGTFRTLQEFHVPQKYFLPLVQTALRLTEPKVPDSNDGSQHPSKGYKDWQKLVRIVESLRGRYVPSLGENGYAVLNTITDLASNYHTLAIFRRERGSLQILAGEWMVSFCHRCEESSFSIDEYLRKAAQNEV